MGDEKQLKTEIIEIGRRLYDLRLVAAQGGNLSARLNRDIILITASGCCLGGLKEEDILTVRLSAQRRETPGLSTEFPLHQAIYQNFPSQKIIHCHPPLTNAYFSVYDRLESITFENKLFLGQVPVVRQSTPSVTQPQQVITALKTNNIVVIKRHGIVSIADNFNKAFYLIEELEEAAKMAGLARLLGKAQLSPFERALKVSLQGSGKAQTMFSPEHIASIVNLINQDDNFLSLAKELDLSTQVAIKMEDKVHKFNFQQGRIVKVEQNDQAPFVINGPAEVWRMIFEGKLDPFVATTQGKLKLDGDLGRLSRWYVPFTRMFALFKEVRIK